MTEEERLQRAADKAEAFDRFLKGCVSIGALPAARVPVAHAAASPRGSHPTPILTALCEPQIAVECHCR
jgi:hypothetical protein